VTTRERMGWLLFICSGVVFLVGGIINGDWWSIVASIPWLAGCWLFLSGGD